MIKKTAQEQLNVLWLKISTKHRTRGVYKLSVNFSVFVDFKIDQPFTDPLTSRDEVFIDLRAVEAEQTEASRHSQ